MAARHLPPESPRAQANTAVKWHPNRGNTDPRSVWHNPRGKSLTIMLWGDSHVSALNIPVTTDGTMIADPANPWW